MLTIFYRKWRIYMEANVISIIQIIVTVIIAFITAYLTNLNERKKQTTVFFKQEGIKVQKEMLDFWCSILFDDYENTIKRYINNNKQEIMNANQLEDENKITETMAIKEVQKNSYMYSSKLTLKYIENYMQEIFKNGEKQRTILQMFLVGKIISNMKYDFTGEKTTVMDLLKIRINDLDIKKKLKIYLYEIKYFFVTRI